MYQRKIEHGKNAGQMECVKDGSCRGHTHGIVLDRAENAEYAKEFKQLRAGPSFGWTGFRR
jgi:hypothetical protein